MTAEAAKGAALTLVGELGWYVFRLEIGHDEKKCDGGTANCKTLRFLDDHWSWASSNDPAVIASWDWSGANAYGIDCGKSGIAVADQDPGDIWPHNGTRVHSTGRGMHHFYADPVGVLGLAAGLRPWGVDLRGVGGLVVGPGSYHPHGEYRVLQDLPVADPPQELLDAAMARRPAAALAVEAAPLDVLSALSRIEGVYRKMSLAPVGQRNTVLNLLAGTAAGVWVRVLEEDQRGELDEGTVKRRLLESVPDDTDVPKSRGTVESGWAYGLQHPVDDDCGLVEEVWEATPTLAAVRAAARSQSVGPDALLCVVLARVLAELPPNTTLPAVVGGPAALNIGVALVGKSGGGKSSLLSVSRRVLGLAGEDQRAIERNVGSGEGIAETFLYDETEIGPRGGLVRTGRKLLVGDPRRVFIADEVGQVEAIGNRSGSTFAPTLRSALTGGTLGQENASSERRRHVPEGAYRLVIVMGVQPSRSGTLLKDTDAGTPQRLVWVTVNDPGAPDEKTPWPSGLGDWQLPAELPEHIDYPGHVKEEVRTARLAQLRDDNADERVGHLLLTRLKVAAALGLLHGEVFITDQWWQLAGRIVQQSMSVQDACRRLLSEEETRSRRSEGRMDGIRLDGAAEYRGERASELAAAIWRQVKKHSNGVNNGNDQRHDADKGCTGRCFGRAARNYSDRETLRPLALEYASDVDWVDERGGRWFLGESSPG